MLKHELMEVFNPEQWARFQQYCAGLPGAKTKVQMPDGRLLDWYNEHDVHEFIKLDVQGQLTLPFEPPKTEKQQDMKIHGPNLLDEKGPEKTSE